MALEVPSAHAAKFGLAFSNKGHNTQTLQAYLGDKNIAHGELHGVVPTRFEKFLEAVLLAKA